MTGNQIAYWNYAENRRRNLEAEDLGRANLAELGRHNQATESLTSRQIALGYGQLAETRRANQARELLQSQANAEIARSNIARETETNRANVAREDETHRSNVQAEKFRIDQLNTDINKFNATYDLDVTKAQAGNFWNGINAFSSFVNFGSKLITAGGK